MKKVIRKAFLTALLIHAPFVINTLLSQPQPPSNPGGGGEQPIGGSAYIGDGLFIMMLLATAYAAYRMIHMYRKLKTAGQE